jgi:hypothetical protein
MEYTALHRDVNLMSLKPFAGGLWFNFDSNEKVLFSEGSMNGSLRIEWVSLVFDS